MSRHSILVMKSPDLLARFGCCEVRGRVYLNPKRPILQDVGCVSGSGTSHDLVLGLGLVVASEL